MIIKSKEISEHLGISQATVSLAINNKPGVSEDTRRRVLEYIEELKQKDSNKIMTQNRSIKVVSFMSERALYDKEHASFKSTILMELSKNAKEAGYNLILIYVHNNEEIIDVIERSENDDTCGFLLLAADMNKEDIVLFERTNIPVVICDFEYDNIEFDCVYNNNDQAIKLVVDYLYQMGHRDIFYLYNKHSIYNFEARREAYKKYTAIINIEAKMLEAGTKIEVIYEFIMKYIKEGNRMPTAFVAENYAISIAAIKALQDCNYIIGENISIVGIDELPAYALVDFDFTYVKVLFESKGRLAINRLFEKIKNEPNDTIRIILENRLIEGSSVKRLV